MKPFSALFVILVFMFTSSCNNNQKKQTHSNQEPKVTFIENDSVKCIDVMIDGKLLTSYRWQDDVCKPFLYPLFTSAGTEITRGFPINPKIGERADHPHQIGMWLTYGNVDGFDFWGNGSQGLGIKNENGGVIKHLKVEKLSEGVGEGSMVTEESWTDPSGIEHLKEFSEYHFIAKGSTRIIDRITTLKAGDKDVSMPDTKEGMLGIRVARQLELPLEGEITLYSADGHPTKVEAIQNEEISGNYMSSEGMSGEAVWGTRARWMDLYGNIGDEKISLVICDHPKNPGYPTYWHARGYGLFAANPLGVNDFTKKQVQMNFVIPAGQSVTFRYRVIITSGNHLTDTEINADAEDFAKKY